MLVAGKGQKELREMKFSLLPWAKFSTFNARLTDFDEVKKKVIPLYEKRTWKKPFENGHCLIPVSTFVEPIYIGEHKGHMVQFRQKSSDPLTAAGIWTESVNPETGELQEGFAMLIHTADDFVWDVGHFRTPLFLQESAFDEWLQGKARHPEEWLRFLLQNRKNLDLEVSADRAMARGWEKRVSDSMKKREREDRLRAMDPGA